MTFSLRLLICAGGTGGGVYPALAVLQTLFNELLAEASLKENPASISAEPALTTLWVGGIRGMEKELIKRAGFPYAEIPAAGLHGVGLKRIPGNLLQLGRGVYTARKILTQFKPDVIFFTGGFLAFPMAVAAKTIVWKGTKPKILLYVPDIEPALALQIIARFADQIAVTTEDTRKFYPKRKDIVVTGYPTRLEHQQWITRVDRKEKACTLFGVEKSRPVTLVYGGSKGARSINRALLANLADLLKITQIIHISGNLDWQEIQNWVDEHKDGALGDLLKDYHPYPYLHEEMSAAFAAADLVVCRAGASILGELPLFGLPAILVPYPHAWRYQHTNAKYLADHSAAVIIEDHQLDSKLLETMQNLFRQPEKLTAMHTAMEKLARPEAAKQISHLIIEQAQTQGGAR
ncbi:MAG: UDP-N-acetylglucosamine--N-acetylmuramyl-(pentapeptide) pyrophosphoryl-undecaprenol N-acetylglucosamine transferase [Anaerolineales bacterium]